jgi:hypothetical protein
MDSLALWLIGVVVPRGRGAITIETSQPVVGVCEDYRGSMGTSRIMAIKDAEAEKETR